LRPATIATLLGGVDSSAAHGDCIIAMIVKDMHVIILPESEFHRYSHRIAN
jgi:hypothetical protein